MLPNLGEWQSLNDEDCTAVAHEIVDLTRQAFEFRKVATYRFGDQSKRIAVFRYANADFVFLPGTTTNLGFRWDGPFPLTPAEQASWESTAAEYNISYSFDEHLGKILSKPREATIQPFLLECNAQNLGLRRLRKNVYTDTPLTHSEASAKVHSMGFTLPTSDQWEYACRGTTIHQPNPYGLNIAQNPFAWEFVDEAHVLRGGDGGGLSCGGAGYLVSWLTLATAYIEHAYREPDTPTPGARVRRAFLL